MLSIQDQVRRLSESDRQAYETLAERFEAGPERLLEGEGGIAPLLPAQEPVRTLLLVHLAKCDMELCHRRGALRPVEDYLLQFAQLAGDPAAKLELLLWEYRLGRAAGARREEFERRFPDLA